MYFGEKDFSKTFWWTILLYLIIDD